MSDDQVARAIGGFASRTVGPAAQAFAQEVVAAADPPSVARARNLLFAASRLGAYGASCGLALSPELLLHPSVIERCCRQGLAGASPATARTVRTNLRFLARRVVPGAPGPAGLARDRAKAPYSAAEIAGFLALADAQPTPARRRRAGALVCLGAGAGLIGGDLRQVRGDDVVARSGGVVVALHGAGARTVPVRGEFCHRLLAAARTAGPRPLIGNGHARRRNVTGPLVSSLAGGTDLPALDVRRLRSTWLARCAEDLGLRAFLDAAGVRCTQGLGDIVAGLAPVPEARCVALLGGRH